MSKIAEAYVEISARMDRMDADLRTAHTKFDSAMGKMQKSSDALAARMTNLKNAYGLISGVIAGAFVGAIGKAINSTAQYLDNIDEMSQKTGVSVEVLTSFDLAAQKAGISLEQFAVGMRNLYRSADQANNGAKESADAFKRLGVSITDANGNLRSGVDLFSDVAEAIDNIANPAEKSALAMKVFGRAGAEMIPMLKGGKEAIKAYIEEAQKHGTIFTKEDVERAVAYADAMDNFTKKLDSLKKKLALEVIPVLTDFISLMSGDMRGSMKGDVLAKDWTKAAIEYVKAIMSGKSQIEAAVIAGTAGGRQAFQRAVDAGNYDKEIQDRYNKLTTFSMDVTAQKYTPGAAAPDKAAKIPSYLGEGYRYFDTEAIYNQVMGANEAMDGLIGKFPELQATVIDTGITVADQLVAPFEDMMFNVGDMWSQTMADFIREGGNWGEFMKDMFADVFESFANMVGQMAARWMANQIFGAITGFNLGGGTFGAGAEVASTGLARMGGGTSIIINAVDTQSFDDALRRNSASVNNIVYESRRYGRES